MKESAKLVKNERGLALWITLMVVGLLIALALQFSRTMRQKYLSSATYRDSRQLHAAAASGINIGRALLDDDGNANEFDTLQDSWAILEQDSLAGLFETGNLVLQVEDLSGRLQVNSLVAQTGGAGGGEQKANKNREILNQLLVSGNLGLEEEQAREIVDALVDWLDEDDRESDFGAESGYYRSLDPPYECRNGPVTIVEELLLVKGITAELLYGAEGEPGLADYLTVYGEDSLININTAPVELIRAIEPNLTQELAEALDEYRRDEGNYQNLQTATWYQNVSSWPGDIELPGELITTTSRYFRVTAEVDHHDLQRRVSVVMSRDKDDVTVELYRKVE